MKDELENRWHGICHLLRLNVRSCIFPFGSLFFFFLYNNFFFVLKENTIMFFLFLICCRDVRNILILFRLVDKRRFVFGPTANPVIKRLAPR